MPDSDIDALRRIRRLESWRKQSIVSTAKERKIIAKLPCQKALVMADFHAPFHSSRVLEWALDRGRECDTVVLAGDTINQDEVSRFAKTGAAANLPIGLELEVMTRLTDMLCARFERVIAIKANHEERLNRYLADRLGVNILKLMQEMGKTSILDYVALNRPNFYVVSEWCHVGNAYISHKELFSKVPMRSVCWADEYFQTHWREETGIAPAVVVQAHTHHQGRMPCKGRILMETGVTCNYIDYALTGRPGPSLSELWYQGCVTLEFDKRKRAILDSCQTHYYGIAKRN